MPATKSKPARKTAPSAKAAKAVEATKPGKTTKAGKPAKSAKSSKGANGAKAAKPSAQWSKAPTRTSPDLKPEPTLVVKSARKPAAPRKAKAAAAPAKLSGSATEKPGRQKVSLTPAAPRKPAKQETSDAPVGGSFVQTLAPPRPAPPASLVPTPKPWTSGKTLCATGPGPDAGTLTLRLQRVIKAPAERIYKAFLDPDAYAKWLPPHGFSGKVHHMEPKVGGTYRMSFNTISRSWGHTFGGRYTELVPNKRIVHTDAFENGPTGTMTVTIDLTPVPGGTRLDITQAGIPKGPMAEGSPTGWGQSLDNLATLCEQELPF